MTLKNVRESILKIKHYEYKNHNNIIKLHYSKRINFTILNNKYYLFN